MTMIYHSKGVAMNSKTQVTTLDGCRNFACANNREGKCSLAKITLQDDGTPIIDRVICVEAENRVAPIKRNKPKE